LDRKKHTFGGPLQFQCFAEFRKFLQMFNADQICQSFAKLNTPALRARELHTRQQRSCVIRPRAKRKPQNSAKVGLKSSKYHKTPQNITKSLVHAVKSKNLKILQNFLKFLKSSQNHAL